MSNGKRGGLARFLHELATSKTKLDAYLENPAETLKNATDLSWEQKFYLLASDLDEIQRLLQEDVEDDEGKLYVTIWIPKPPPRPPTIWGTIRRKPKPGRKRTGTE